MIACVCKSIGEGAVRAAVRDGATTYKAVAAATEAGTCCGTCRPFVFELIQAELMRNVPAADFPRAADGRLPAAS